MDGYHTGGNQWSLDADAMFGMDKYVHLCLRTNHPMEHIARNEGRIEKTAWLYIDAASVFKHEGVLYSYDVSNKSGMKIVPIEQAACDIDFQVLYTRTDWHDPDINARLFSVKPEIVHDLGRGFGVCESDIDRPPEVGHSRHGDRRSGASRGESVICLTPCGNLCAELVHGAARQRGN